MIDRKFKVLAVNPCKGSVYTEKDGVFSVQKTLRFLQGLYLVTAKHVRHLIVELNTLKVLT